MCPWSAAIRHDPDHEEDESCGALAVYACLFAGARKQLFNRKNLSGWEMTSPWSSRPGHDHQVERPFQVSSAAADVV
jgi:hypothetical protein